MGTWKIYKVKIGMDNSWIKIINSVANMYSSWVNIGDGTPMEFHSYCIL